MNERLVPLQVVFSGVINGVISGVIYQLQSYIMIVSHRFNQIHHIRTLSSNPMLNS